MSRGILIYCAPYAEQFNGTFIKYVPMSDGSTDRVCCEYTDTNGARYDHDYPHTSFSTSKYLVPR